MKGRIAVVFVFAMCTVGGFAVVPAPHPAAASQDKFQQKCTNQMNKSGAKVAKVQGNENRYCVTKAGKEKLEGTAMGCLTADHKGKVAKTQQKTLTVEAKKCDGVEPDFGTSDGATVNAAAVREELNFVYDIFGTNLDEAILTDSIGARCQKIVSNDYERIARTKLKVFDKCTKDALKDGAADASAIEACFGPDPKEKVARAVAKLGKHVQTTCGVVDLATAFPGTCAQAGDFAACVEERIDCRLCSMLNAMDDLNMDCELLDDQVDNGSCIPIATSPVTGTLVPCTANDVWQFEVSAGQTIIARVDTTDLSTAADYGPLQVSCGNGDFGVGDDEFECTFPPPQFACPEVTIVATSDTICTVTVSAFSSLCADPDLADYELSVTLDGAPIPLLLTTDN